MMAIRFIVFICFHWLTLAYSQSSDGTRSQESSETSTRSQGSPLMGELSKLLLNIDEAFYRVTAPKVELEQNFEEQKIREMPDPIRSYFDRVRENYRSLQNRIGSTLDASDGSFKIPNLFDINFQNKGSKTAVGVSLPFLPLDIKVNAKSPPTKKPLSTEEQHQTISETQKQVPNSDTSEIEDKKEEKIGSGNQKESLEKDSSGTPGEFQKRSSRYPELPRQVPKDDSSVQHTKSMPSKETSEHLEMRSSEKENNPLEQESEIQGRILGDLLYSESTFDKYFRRLLRNFKWLVDPSVFPQKEILENIRDVTSQFSAVSQNKKTGPKEDTFTSKVPQKMKQRNQNIEIKDTEPVHKVPLSGSRPDRNSKIVLAFTPEGMPLKLKIDSRSKSAMKFLHESLSAAGVSLNIPVESHKHVQPVGSDVLQLGSVPRGIEAQTLYVDTTNSKQFKSLLKNLRKFKGGA